jgi:chromosome partitioning protein
MRSRSPNPIPRVATSLAVVQEKGGVGKTTLAVNLAVGLAATDRKTLLIDLDPLASASRHLGFGHANDGRTVIDVIRGRAGLQPPEDDELDSSLDRLFHTKSVPTAARPFAEIDNLFVVPSARGLLRTERDLRDALWLRRAIAAIPPSSIDVAIVDTPPRFGPLTISALCAVQRVVAPTELRPMSLAGLERVVEDIAAVRQRFNPQLDPTPWIVPSRVRRTRIDAWCASDLEAWYPGRVLPGIRENIRLAEAPAFHMSIYRFAPRSNGATDFAMLTGVLARHLAPARPRRIPA